ncbi:PREDICTED: protein kinase C-binding protein 1 isoform X1 [Polistes dominula]|uniref:Protein kinase C-binding protein 1 isoform X1 n=1 Tax=Polistes dominula TaxID=743375 RepID=A0ABM1J9W2_POLDO|nr:PREDICTED: protein kinase C-binding protein 1 isoform X1 [Polistes dominula]XP_015189249.1 PREDICTED: protein kinase C-binding protein 1 isoform X1 [Polistes dominula]XP_015189250.1 PREDICTED: protein kinase C-binding protein 1 isoform X1 [Polistes dominula]
MDTSTKLNDDIKLVEGKNQCSVSNDSKNDSSLENAHRVDITNTNQKEKQDIDKVNTINDADNENNTENITANTSCVKIENESDSENIIESCIDVENNIQIKEVKKETKNENLTEDTSSNANNAKENCEKDTTEDTTEEKSINNIKRKHGNLSTQESTSSSEENGVRNKRKKFKNTNDKYCWRCHKESTEALCSACPRSWHRRCLGGTPPTSVHNWICGECATILKAENAETRSAAMAQLSVDQLCMLLKHVVQRMREYSGSEPFWKPVELNETPNYLDYVFKPMDLNLLESNVRSKLYGSTDAFMSDAKWIQHNCIVYNTCGGLYADTSKLTNIAKQIIKVARHEVAEIEACPDCYAHSRNLPRPQPSWFIEPCRQPHPLVWAKLKGFPFWPAKAMPRLNAKGSVDVRFFGEHDRAWIQPRDLFLYSEDPPAPLPRKRKVDMDECVREITRHCRKLELVFGKFKFAPPKVQYNPHDPMQIKLMLPNYDPLQLNNCTSSEFLVPKKKAVFRKRNLSIKDKSQTETSANDSKLDSDTNASDDENKSRNKIQKLTRSNQSSPSSDNSINLDLLQNELQKKVINIENKTSTEDVSLVEDNEPIKSDRKDINEENNTNTRVQRSNESNVPSLRNNLHITHDNVMSTDQILKPNESSKLEQVSKKHSTVKAIPNKSNTSEILKIASKPTKNTAKVYKPKTRLVDKLNAEKALKFLSENEQKNKMGSPSIESIAQVTRSLSQTDKHDLLNKTTNGTIIPSVSTFTTITQNNTRSSSVSNSTIGQTTPVTSNKSTDIVQQSILAEDNITNKESCMTTKSGSKEQKRESKARKSFPNKPPVYPQITLHSSSNTLSSSIESIIYNPSPQKENVTGYQLLPPEAGPLSARLYHGAEELAKRMAQLMEEAYQEAAHNSQNCEDDSTDKHHATVHFLRLQIERMRWQHQQQLAELKHNTDRMLREMKASLEAEQLRAVEETRREMEQEKIRCIEETKRKQWCAMCHREALFYCCWNTAYCDYACQQSHWTTHMRTCAQKPSFTTIVTTASVGSSQPQTNNTKVCTPACRVYSLPRNKSPGLSKSHYVSCSKNENN